MSDDIRLSTALSQHPKLKKLELRLGAGACWALIKLFCWVGDNRSDGDLVGLSNEDLELAIDWTGPKPLIPVLRSIGFLDGDERGYVVHGWAEHQPFVATKADRVQRSREAAMARWSKATPEEKSRVGHALVSARAQKQAEASATCSGRADSTSGDVAPTCDPHVSNVPSTHARTPRTPPTPSRQAQKAAPSEAAIRLAALLRKEILQNNPTHRFKEGQEQSWAREADLMLRRDGRTEAEMRELITWCQADEFWKSNVLSMGKLREKFDQLRLKKKSKGAGGHNAQLHRSQKTSQQAERVAAMLETDGLR